MSVSKQNFIEEREYEQQEMNVNTTKNKSKMINLEKIKQQLINEEIDALETFGKLKVFEKEFEDVLAICKKQALIEAENYEKDFQLKGYQFEKKNGRAMYNFKGIKAWAELESKKKEVEARAKNAFNAYKLGNTSISEDGEVNELPIVTFTSDVLSVKKI